MRASDFITETTRAVGKLHPDQTQTMPITHRLSGTADRLYDLHRVMMAVASSDGKDFSHDPDEESWIGRNNIATPYTKLESDMLQHAYRAVKTWNNTAVDGYPAEPKDINKTSPIAKPKTNRYGV